MKAKNGFQVQMMPFTRVTLQDTFWATRLETNRKVTVAYDFRKCEETGRLANFDRAAGRAAGGHEGRFYNDSDVFKVIEGAAYVLATEADPELDAYLDDLIERIAAAQEEDGYLYTARTIAERTGNLDALSPEQEGMTRWSNLRVNHELYNVGHLYEAAVAHYQATGKRTLLDVALRNADLLDQVFGPLGRRDVPGHEEIEIGLMRLYGVTGEARYLAMAHFFLDERGHAHGRSLYGNHGSADYMQDHLPVIEQSEAVGHAVRAGYLYCGMADVAVATGQSDYLAALDRIWSDMVTRKLYITGGIGAQHQGESFGEAYELPNDTAYNETCAAIASILWNVRMFQIYADARYLDIVERTLYNGFLAGVDFRGDRFFYTNPLAADGVTPVNRGTVGRQPWFQTSCCPTNVVRFLPALPGFVYGYREDAVFVNLYVAGWALVPVARQDVRFTQETNYPWEGVVRIGVLPARPVQFAVHLRIPGWARNQPVPGDLYAYADGQVPTWTVRLNGEPVQTVEENGFVVLDRVWQPNDTIALALEMPVRRVVTHSAVAANRGRVAIERGPLVYCAEGVDNGGRVDGISVADDDRLAAAFVPDLLRGVTRIDGESVDGRRYRLVPYYAWAHRGDGEMAVWLPRKP